MATGQEMFAFSEEKEGVTCLALVGGVLVTGCRDNTLKSWDPETGRLRHTFAGHSEEVTHAAFSGDVLISGGRDKTVRSWNLATGGPLDVFVGHAAPVSALALAGGAVVSAGEDRALHIWDLWESGERQAPQGHTGRISSLALAGEAVASGGWDGTIRTWEAGTGREMHTLVGHSKAVRRLCVSGKSIISSSEDGTVRCWDISAGTPLWSLEEDVTEAGWNKEIAVSGNLLVIGTSAGSLKGYDLETGSLVREYPNIHGIITCLAISRDILAAAAGIDREIIIKTWHLSTGKERHVFTGPEKPVYRLALSGDLLVSADNRFRSGGLRSWNVGTGDAGPIFERPDYLENHVRGISSIYFAGGVLVSAGSGFGEQHQLGAAGYTHTLISWDLSTGEPLQIFRGHTHIITAVLVAGGALLSGSVDGTIRVWNLKDGSLLYTLLLDEPIREMKYDPLRKILIAGGEKGGVYFLECNLAAAATANFPGSLKKFKRHW